MIFQCDDSWPLSQGSRARSTASFREQARSMTSTMRAIELCGITSDTSKHEILHESGTLPLQVSCAWRSQDQTNEHIVSHITFLMRQQFLCSFKKRFCHGENWEKHVQGCEVTHNAFRRGEAGGPWDTPRCCSRWLSNRSKTTHWKQPSMHQLQWCKSRYKQQTKSLVCNEIGQGRRHMRLNGPKSLRPGAIWRFFLFCICI